MRILPSLLALALGLGGVACEDDEAVSYDELMKSREAARKGGDGGTAKAPEPVDPAAGSPVRVTDNTGALRPDQGPLINGREDGARVPEGFRTYMEVGKETVEIAFTQISATIIPNKSARFEVSAQNRGNPPGVEKHPTTFPRVGFNFPIDKKADEIREWSDLLGRTFTLGNLMKGTPFIYVSDEGTLLWGSNMELRITSVSEDAIEGRFEGYLSQQFGGGSGGKSGQVAEIKKGEFRAFLGKWEVRDPARLNPDDGSSGRRIFGNDPPEPKKHDGPVYSGKGFPAVEAPAPKAATPAPDGKSSD